MKPAAISENGERRDAAGRKGKGYTSSQERKKKRAASPA